MAVRRLILPLCALMLATSAPAQPLPFVVVVNPQTPVSALSREALARIFLRKVVWWENGLPMRPVDLSYDSEVRQRFSDRIIGRSVPAVRSHWQQAIFSGQEAPPPVFATDAEVLRYVKRHRGAIGYVSTQAPLEGVRAVQIE